MHVFVCVCVFIVLVVLCADFYHLHRKEINDQLIELINELIKHLRFFFKHEWSTTQRALFYAGTTSESHAYLNVSESKNKTSKGITREPCEHDVF